MIVVFSFYYIIHTNFLIYYPDWLVYYSDWLPNLVCHIRTIQKLFGNTIKLNLKGQIAAIAEDAQKKVLNVFKVKKLVQ